MLPDERDAPTAELEVRGGGRDRERRERQRVRVPSLTVLFHPDVRRIGERAWLSALATGGAIELSRLRPGFAAPGLGRKEALVDPFLSRRPLRLKSDSGGGIRMSVGEGGTRVEADGAAIEGERLFEPAEIERGVVLELAGRVVLLLHRLPPLSVQEEPPGFDLVGDSEAAQRLRHDIQRVADLEVPVLLQGETGTGKEIAAQAIHKASRRGSKICLSVNLGAIPSSLAAGELFGSLRGAYTGADRSRAGFFTRAHGGTLFLDEVGDAPPEVQVMLLRVLESGEIQQVGGSEPKKVDVRVIAATDTDLEKAIDEGRFRAPLLHRLAAYTITVPPLRERRDDLGRLLIHFLRQELRGLGEEARLELGEATDTPWLAASIVARLARYSWPGNVRQLLNIARQLVIESRGSDHARVGAQLERLLREVEAEGAPPPAAGESPGKQGRRRKASYRRPSEVTEEELIKELRANRFRLKPTAARLGVSRTSLYALIERSDHLRKAADLTPQEIEGCGGELAGDLDAMAAKLEVSASGLRQRMKELGLGLKRGGGP